MFLAALKQWQTIRPSKTKHDYTKKIRSNFFWMIYHFFYLKTLYAPFWSEWEKKKKYNKKLISKFYRLASRLLGLSTCLLFKRKQNAVGNLHGTYNHSSVSFIGRVSHEFLQTKSGWPLVFEIFFLNQINRNNAR